MAHENQTELFTNKHLRLMNIAKFARILSWIALIVNVLLALMKTETFMRDMTFYDQAIDTIYVTDFIIPKVFTIYNLVVSGGVAYVVLTGISYGLNILVETDVNYRIKQNSSGVANG